MSIDDKIKDEKLQYDINREAAKISALSSGKIDKYEYVTGEEIIPPHQRREIEQATFAYSPLGKAFEKQTKVIEERGEKQIKSLKGRGKYKDSDQKFLTCSKQKQIFNEIANERMKEIEDLSKQIDTNSLIYHYKGKIPSKDFIVFEGPQNFYNGIREGYLTLKKAGKEQKEFKKEISELL